jgi:hypothetical protein
MRSHSTMMWCNFSAFTFFHLFSLAWRWLTIISFSSLSYDRSKASSPHSVIQSFLFQMRVSSPFLKVIQSLPMSIHSEINSIYIYIYIYIYIHSKILTIHSKIILLWGELMTNYFNNNDNNNNNKLCWKLNTVYY